VCSYGEGCAYSWNLTKRLDTEFCLDALEMFLEGDRKPEIFHSDQGCQLTSADVVSMLQAQTIRNSWFARKRCYDNIPDERLWCTVKYAAKASVIPTCL
jgi:putative transposase